MENDALLQAISFAAREHLGQTRKDRKTPYVAHPFRVMLILSHLFGVRDPEILAAAVLHDAIEDTTADRDEIAENFGEGVAAYVAALTKDKRLPEQEREDLYFKSLGEAPVEVQLCKLGDTLDNLMDSASLPAELRRKAASKAMRLVSLLEVGFPKEWAHALESVRSGARAIEGTL